MTSGGSRRRAPTGRAPFAVGAPIRNVSAAAVANSLALPIVAEVAGVCAACPGTPADVAGVVDFPTTSCAAAAATALAFSGVMPLFICRLRLCFSCFSAPETSMSAAVERAGVCIARARIAAAAEICRGVWARLSETGASRRTASGRWSTCRAVSRTITRSTAPASSGSRASTSASTSSQRLYPSGRSRTRELRTSCWNNCGMWADSGGGATGGVCGDAGAGLGLGAVEELPFAAGAGAAAGALPFAFGAEPCPAVGPGAEDDDGFARKCLNGATRPRASWTSATRQPSWYVHCAWSGRSIAGGRRPRSRARKKSQLALSYGKRGSAAISLTDSDVPAGMEAAASTAPVAFALLGVTADTAGLANGGPGAWSCRANPSGNRVTATDGLSVRSSSSGLLALTKRGSTRGAQLSCRFFSASRHQTVLGLVVPAAAAEASFPDRRAAIRAPFATLCRAPTASDGAPAAPGAGRTSATPTVCREAESGIGPSTASPAAWFGKAPFACDKSEAEEDLPACASPGAPFPSSPFGSRTGDDCNCPGARTRPARGRWWSRAPASSTPADGDRGRFAVTGSRRP
jgi:hypothetical protein